ncbi:MAG TPA: Flp family type IVb pilin [Hyphomicrobiaceae bacterium]|nr:Flp family type IVb pilin [Hyphomicrobiaceae bacterium]
MQRLLAIFWRNESGATAIEYGLIAAFIAVALVTTLVNVGTEVKGPFVDAEAGLKKRPAI